MNNIDKQYQELLQDILNNGIEKKDRTGTGTISVFGRQIRHKMSEGFPLLTTKKMAWKTMVTELLWFLRGDTNIKYLVDNDCHIWDGDAFKYYTKKVNEIIDGYKCGDIMGMQDHIEKLFSDSDKLTPLTMDEFINKIKTDDEFANKWGELGPIYGKQWRSWKTQWHQLAEQEGYTPKWAGDVETEVDQIANLINDLKTNPDSRRLMVSAWNVGELDQMVLPPCHYGFQVYTRELSELERHDIKEQYGFDCRKLAKPSIKQLDDANIPTRAISLMYNARSQDVPLGTPFNLASYGLLLMILAKEVNMVPDELIANMGDCHIYLNQIDGVKEQIGRDYTQEEIQEHLQQSGMDALTEEARMEYVSKLPKRTREPFELPTLNILHNPCKDIELEGKTADISCYNIFDFQLENYQSHPPIKMPLSN
jgi:thymidylate synthase